MTMAKQFLATTNGITMSFPSNSVRIVQCGLVSFIDFNIRDYPTNETFDTLFNLANSGGTEQVKTTILRVNSAVQINPIFMSFPIGRIAINNSKLSNSNSVITYNGSMYYALETKDALVAASNTDNGGGSGGNTIYTGDGSLAGNRTVDLNGNVLIFTQGVIPMLSINDEGVSQFGFTNPLDSTFNSLISFVAPGDTDGSSFNIAAMGNSNQVSIVGSTFTNKITYTADTHTFHGSNVNFDIGASGTFTSQDGKTVTVVSGLITSIV